MQITIAETINKIESIDNIISGMNRESDVRDYIYDATKFLKEYQQILLDTTVKF